LLWLDAEVMGGFEKNVRRRFYLCHVQAADDHLEIMGDIEAGQDAVNRVPV